MALRGSHADPVQDRGDGGIRKEASKVFDKMFRCRAGLPTMLPCATLHYLQGGMIATFPVKLEPETVRLGLDDHLFQDRAQDPFARFDGGGATAEAPR